MYTLPYGMTIKSDRLKETIQLNNHNIGPVYSGTVKTAVCAIYRST